LRCPDNRARSSGYRCCSSSSGLTRLRGARRADPCQPARMSRLTQTPGALSSRGGLFGVDHRRSAFCTASVSCNLGKEARFARVCPGGSSYPHGGRARDRRRDSWRPAPSRRGAGRGDRGQRRAGHLADCLSRGDPHSCRQRSGRDSSQDRHQGRTARSVEPPRRGRALLAVRRTGRCQHGRGPVRTEADRGARDSRARRAAP
jgi:hypothetical protein